MMNEQFEAATSELLPCTRCGKMIPKTEQMCPYCSSMQIRNAPHYEQAERATRNLRFEVSSTNPFFQMVIGDFDGRLNIAAFAFALFAVLLSALVTVVCLGFARVGAGMLGVNTGGVFFAGILALAAAYLGILGSVALLRDRAATGNLFCSAGLSLLAGIVSEGTPLFVSMFLFVAAAMLALIDSKMMAN